MKIKKKMGGGGGRVGGGGGGSGWGGGQSGKEWRSGEAFVKIKKKILFFFLGWGGRVRGGGGRVGGGQGGWERRIEAFVKIRVRSGVGVGKVGVARFWVDG